MRINDTVLLCALPMTAAPVFRAFEGTPASSSRSVAVVSGAHVAKASDVFGLKSLAVSAVDMDVLGAVALGIQAYARPELAQLRRRPEQAPLQGWTQVQRQVVLDELVDRQGGTGSNGSQISTNGYTSNNGTNNCTKPMNPWDFRTSSPPG